MEVAARAASWGWCTSVAVVTPQETEHIPNGSGRRHHALSVSSGLASISSRSGGGPRPWAASRLLQILQKLTSPYPPSTHQLPPEWHRRPPSKCNRCSHNDET